VIFHLEIGFQVDGGHQLSGNFEKAYFYVAEATFKDFSSQLKMSST
jgi:hypothetical protein